MKTIIATIGLISFGSMFVGTALVILFAGFEFGFQVFTASILIFLFSIVCQKIIDSNS